MSIDIWRFKSAFPPEITEIETGNRMETAHRPAAAARQCCAPIPGYPMIAAKLELAMNATDILGQGTTRTACDVLLTFSRFVLENWVLSWQGTKRGTKKKERPVQ
jgi:hypothetical protein